MHLASYLLVDPVVIRGGYPAHHQSTHQDRRSGSVSVRRLRSLARILIFLQRMPENQVVFPKYHLLFCPKMAI